MRKVAGFTLIELLIVIAIVGILAAIFYPYLTGGIPSVGEVENTAREFLNKKEVAFRGLTCMDLANDSNGYRSCTYVDSRNELRTIECSAYNRNRGCRVPGLYSR